MIAQHVPFTRELATSWLLHLALIAALAALLAASYFAPLAAHAITTSAAFSASHAPTTYIRSYPSCSALPAPC